MRQVDGEPKVDDEGDLILNINLNKHFKIFNFDKVNYFDERDIREVTSALKAKKFGAPIYCEDVIAEIVDSPNVNAKRKRAAMTNA